MIEAPLILGAELLRGGVPMDGLHYASLPEGSAPPITITIIIIIRGLEPLRERVSIR
jgi:hypothetical protein